VWRAGSSRHADGQLLAEALREALAGETLPAA